MCAEACGKIKAEPARRVHIHPEAAQQLVAAEVDRLVVADIRVLVKLVVVDRIAVREIEHPTLRLGVKRQPENIANGNIKADVPRELNAQVHFVQSPDAEADERQVIAIAPEKRLGSAETEIKAVGRRIAPEQSARHAPDDIATKSNVLRHEGRRFHKENRLNAGVINGADTKTVFRKRMLRDARELRLQVISRARHQQVEIGIDGAVLVELIDRDERRIKADAALHDAIGTKTLSRLRARIERHLRLHIIIEKDSGLEKMLRLLDRPDGSSERIRLGKKRLIQQNAQT